jgi:hypothetical protein
MRRVFRSIFIPTAIGIIGLSSIPSFGQNANLLSRCQVLLSRAGETFQEWNSSIERLQWNMMDTNTPDIDWSRLYGKRVHLSIHAHAGERIGIVGINEVLNALHPPETIVLRPEPTRRLTSFFSKSLQPFLTEAFQRVKGAPPDFEVGIFAVRDKAGWRAFKILTGGHRHIPGKEVVNAINELKSAEPNFSFKNADLLFIHSHPGLQPFNLEDKEHTDDITKYSGFRSGFGVAFDSSVHSIDDSVSFIYHTK